MEELQERNASLPFFCLPIPVNGPMLACPAFGGLKKVSAET